MKTERRHHFALDPDSGPDHRGEYRCLCTLPFGNEIHEVSGRTEEERQHEARKVGER